MTDGDPQHSIYDQIGKEINEGNEVSGKTSEERLIHLARAEELILNQEGTSVLDNFLDEMTNFIQDRDKKVRCFVISFIEKACKKDPEVFKKAIPTLGWAITESSKPQAVDVLKRVILTCKLLYPVILKWASQKRSTDTEAIKCWEDFTMLKGRIMQMINSKNEGVRTGAFKFLEVVIVCQTAKSEFSEIPASAYQMSLDEINRDSFISYRQLATEATHSFESLLEQMGAEYTSALNLATIISCCVSISRQRPEFFTQLISSLESLNLNLPPTLGTNQVKSVRKDMKMALLRLLKHPASFTSHDRIRQLLAELGATQNEIQKAMPAPTEISESLRRRVATAAATSTTGGTDTAGPSGHRRPMEDVDLRDVKRLKLDDDDYDDAVADLGKQLDDLDSATTATQRAVEMTTDWVKERLSISVVTKLVIISLYTLPDEMPAAFASSYTPIHEAGSEEQKQHLARMMAIQLTKEGEGPGIQHIKMEKQKLYMERQAARSKGAVIPPTPTADRMGGTSSGQDKDKFMQPQLPTKKVRAQAFNLFAITRELLPKEAQQMILKAFKRIMDNEKRAVQGGASLAQQKLVVRLATRFRSLEVTSELETMLLNFIIEDQKSRTDLALLWIAELYAQLMGFSYCIIPGPVQMSDVERMIRYDTCLCNILSILYERGEHKETLFHRIFLEVPFITPAALKILRKACLDKVYGAFAMTTLRELILTRARQRHDLLRLLLEFSYFDRNDIKEHCIKTAKELYQLDYVRGDVRQFVMDMTEYLVHPTAPRVIWHANTRLDKKIEEGVEEMPWDETLIKAALHLFLALLPNDHSLLHQLASVCARANNEIKRVTFRSIELAIKSIGMHSEELLAMIENCPSGAETLVARVVHLLTERQAPTVELVDRVRKLHQSRNTDVRSLIPILNGLSKEELRDLIPKFVLSATNSKSVPVFFKRLIFGKHIETQEPLMSPMELLIELHRITTANIKEHGHLLTNLDLLLVDRDREFNLTKDVIANTVEALLNEPTLPALLPHSLEKIRENFPSLGGYLTNISTKIAQRKEKEAAAEAAVRKLEPAFAHFGIDGEPNALLEVSDGGGHRMLLVGTNRGVCSLFSLNANRKIANLYEDPENRQIMAIGRWPFPAKESEQTTSEESPPSPTAPPTDSELGSLFWLHYRASSVAVFEFPNLDKITAADGDQPSEDLLCFNLVKNVSTTHYGFCRALADERRARFFIPDQEGTSSSLRIRYKSGGEKAIVLSEDYLRTSYQKRPGKSTQIDPSGLFKGQIMGIEVVRPEVEGNPPEDRILLAFEDSTIAVFDLDTKQVVDCLKHPKHQQFVCWAVVPRSKSPSLDVAVSVIGQVYLLCLNSWTSEFKSECVIRRGTSVNCTSLALSTPSSSKSTPLMVACGLSNGAVEVYRILYSSDVGAANTTRPEKCAQIDFHEKSVGSLRWLASEAESTAEEESTDTRRSLCVGSADEKLAFYDGI